MINRFKILKEEYRINFKVGLIISLLFCILLFLFFPYIAPPSPPPMEYQSLIFTISDVAPSTTQQRPANMRPPLPKIYVPDDVEEPVILSDVEITSKGDEGDNQKKGEANNKTGTGVLDVPELPFVPRQILEVLPKKIDDDVKGFVNLQLKIGTDGKVIEYKVIKNTTGSNDVLNQVIDAAYRSKWEPIKIKNNKVVYWVEKTYNFN